MTRVLISAGDASGDLHAAELVATLKARHPELEFFGLGGDEMARVGVELVVHQRELAIGGLVELLGAGPRILAAWRQLAARLESEVPQLAVLVDSGGFNLPLARRIRRRSRAPILYYVAPQVWAWRKGRIAKLAQRVDRLAVIFPFEAAIYEGKGINVECVGHPLVEKLEALAGALDRDAARRSLDLSFGGPLVAIFPGSRGNEIRSQLPVQLEAAALLHERRPELEFILVVAPTVRREHVDEEIARANLPEKLALAIVEGRSQEVMIACDVALAKPGTTTVELAILARPMVVIGRTSALTAMVLRRVVEVPHYAMPNLIAGREIVPELLQEQARPEAIAAALERLLVGPERDRQLADLAGVSRALGRGGAARRTAEIVEEMLASRSA